jgi:hypothetical protein
MKKFYMVFFITVFAFPFLSFSQQAYIKAPPVPTTTSSIKAPNGTNAHVTFRGCYLLTPSELSVIATNTAINSIGFFLTQGTNVPAVTGSIQVYLQNTADATYLKNYSYSTAIAPMTSVYNSTMLVTAGGASTINLPLPTAFPYTGGGLYVAFDWIATGPFATGAAVYQADNSLAGAGAAVSTTAVPAADAMVANNTRPAIRVGYINSLTNEAEAYGLLGNGRQPLYNGSPYTFSVIVRNNAGVTMTNVVPTLSVSGASTFVTTTTIASIPAGGTVMASFPSYTPDAQGINTITVILPPDDNNANNIRTVTQSVTCNYLHPGPGPQVPLTSFNQGVGFGNNSGLLLARIRVPSTSTLNALRLCLPIYANNNGNSVYGVLTNSGGSILATTSTVVITGAMGGTYQTFTFASPPNINANTDYWIGMAQPANTVTPYFPLASLPSPSNNIPANLYGTSVLGGGLVSSSVPTLGVFGIEAVFYNSIDLTVTPPAATICTGNSTTLSANGATTYSWSTGASTSSIVVSPNLYTVYTVTGSAVVGTVGVCEQTKNIAMAVNITPTISCANGAICPIGGSHTLAPAGAATYSFSGGGPVVSPSVTTSYTVTGTSAAGCPAGNTVVPTVSVSNNPTVSVVGPTMICNGTTASLTAYGATSYSWSNGSLYDAVLVNPTISTSYTIVGTFGTCSTSAVHSLSVSPNPTLTAQTSKTLLCIGNTATLSAFGASTYTWSTGQIGLTTTVSPSTTTTYTLIGAVNGLCTQTITFTQNVDPCVGLDEHSAAGTVLNIYPNPGIGVFTIFVSSYSEKTRLEIFNAIGQLILSKNLHSQQTDLDLRLLPKGLYFAKLSEKAEAIRTVRLIIQ